MFFFEVDPGWYEKYWLTDKPHSKRAGSLTRFVVVIALLVGSSAALSQLVQH